LQDTPASDTKILERIQMEKNGFKIGATNPPSVACLIYNIYFTRTAPWLLNNVLGFVMTLNGSTKRLSNESAAIS
jgi:hypothetical protein